MLGIHVGFRWFPNLPEVVSWKSKGTRQWKPQEIRPFVQALVGDDDEYSLDKALFVGMMMVNIMIFPYIPLIKALFVGGVKLNPLDLLQIRRHQGLRKPFGLGCQEPTWSC